MSDQNETIAVKAFGAVESGKVFNVPLECVGTYNVRKVLPRLPENMTYEVVLKMALGTPEQKSEMVRIVEEHEAETLRLNPKAHTVIMLAESIHDLGQQQPIIVRQTGMVNRRDVQGNVIDGEKRYGYMIVMGGRRTMAIAYLYAMDLIPNPVVLGIQKKVTKEQALDMSIAENLQRADFTEREIGEYVAMYRDKGMTWAAVSEKMRRSVPTLMASYSLVRPDSEDAPDDLAEQVESGALTKGEAVQIARGEAPLGDGGKRLFRKTKKALPVKAIESLVDTTDRDEVGMIRISTLAEVLQISVEDAIKASDDRILKEEKKARKASRENDETLKAEQKALEESNKEQMEELAELDAMEEAEADIEQAALEASAPDAEDMVVEESETEAA